MAAIDPERRAIESALAVARKPVAGVADILRAAETLMAHAMLDESTILLERAGRMIQSSGIESGGFFERLFAVNHVFRQMRMDRKVKELGAFRDRLSSRDDMILWQVPGAETLLVVFATMFNDFWVSFPVLHCLLAPNSFSVLYLKDFNDRMYLSGVRSVGPDFASLVSAVRGIAAEHSIRNVKVMGFSSGGYAGLLLASQVDASAYLGFSIRTDLDRQTQLPIDRLASAPHLAEEVPHLLLDLKPVMMERAAPRLGVLYYGDKAVIDAAHAKHFAGVPGFILKPVPGALHNTVMALLARNEFGRALKAFLRRG